MARSSPQTPQPAAPPRPETAVLRAHGRHLPAAQDGAEQIAWRGIHGTPDRARLHDQTCTCRTPLFEYVSAGGLYFVRPITYGTPVVVEESPKLPEWEAMSVWAGLLTGQAR